MKNRKLHLIWLLVISFYINSCVEPFEIKSITYESALVIEATITNEYKYHEIILSRTFKIEENGVLAESNADVKIIDNLQNVYKFLEDSPGKYKSQVEFSAEANTSYQLLISTENGSTYSSNSIKLTSAVEIDEIRVKKDDDDSGVSILITSFNPSGNANYYRYEYEETYKIVAPRWSSEELKVVSETPPYELEIVDKTIENKICYNTEYSKGIIQTETSDFNEDRVSNFKVRHILRDNIIIAHRYSILVKQYVQSPEAYTFLKILNDLSNSESLFSQNQPGFVNGNIVSKNNPDEKVIGFFEVSSVTSKRMFFSHRDLGLSPPSYPEFAYDCTLIAPIIGKDLIEFVKLSSWHYYYENDGMNKPIVPPGGPYVMVRSECGDCTSVGSNIMPNFWIE